MDDNVLFKLEYLANGVYVSVFKMPLGISRIISISSIISAVHVHRKWMEFGQVIELELMV